MSRRHSDDARDGALDLVEERRLDVEERLAELRASIGRELGVVPKAGYAVLGLVAAASGFALAARRRKRRKGAARDSTKPDA